MKQSLKKKGERERERGSGNHLKAAVLQLSVAVCSMHPDFREALAANVLKEVPHDGGGVPELAVVEQRQCLLHSRRRVRPAQMMMLLLLSTDVQRDLQSGTVWKIGLVSTQTSGTGCFACVTPDLKLRYELSHLSVRATAATSNAV